MRQPDRDLTEGRCRDSGETVWVVIGDGVYPIDSADESPGAPIFPPEECPSGCVGEQLIQAVERATIGGAISDAEVGIRGAPGGGGKTHFPIRVRAR
jgi:hypothetical protein